MAFETHPWTKIDASDFKPDYIDVPGNRLRAYGAYIVVDDHPDRYALIPYARHLTFVKYFAIGFVPLFMAIAFSFIPGKEKWMFVCGGPIAGGFVFTLIYYLLCQEVKNGPYIEYDPESNLVRLPRYNTEVCRNAIVCLQWITGGSKHRFLDRSTDVNLIVQCNDERNRRYFLLGAPTRRLVIELADKLGVPVIEVTLGLQGKRDIDATTVT